MAQSLQRFGPRLVRVPILLPTLIPATLSEDQDVITIEFQVGPATAVPEWKHHWRLDDDEVGLSLAMQESDYLLRFPDVCDFLLQFEPSRILIKTETAVELATVEHLLVDQVLPRFLAHRGALLVHASAVEIEGRTALFIGQSGRGKSTLAGLLQSSGQRILSDDCLCVELHEAGVTAMPTYPSLRLYADSLAEVMPHATESSAMAENSDKRRVPVNLADGDLKPSRVAALYLLGDPALAPVETAITSVRPAEACLALIRDSFQLDVTDRSRMVSQLGLCSEVARRLPAFRLDYPRDFSRSSTLLQRLGEHLQSLPPSLERIRHVTL
jgi:hypothetical protein